MSKKLAWIVGLLLAAGTLCAQQRDTLAVRDTVAVTTMSKADSLIAYAKTFMGKPYKLGAEGPYYYDCSSFVRAAFRGIGIELPRNTIRQIREGGEHLSAQVKGLHGGFVGTGDKLVQLAGYFPCVMIG